MADEISVQILSQTSENIRKLFDLSTRIDERLIAVHDKQNLIDQQIKEISHQHVTLMQKIAVLESKDEDNMASSDIADCEKAIADLDKRLSGIENDKGKHDERWRVWATFAIQLVWVVLAAWVLTKLNLQPPAIP